MIYTIYIYSRDADTQIYCQEGGGGGADLLPIALLLQWLGLPALVSQRIITGESKANGQKSLLNSYTKTRGQIYFPGTVIVKIFEIFQQRF